MNKRAIKILIVLAVTVLAILFFDIGCVFKSFLGFPCPGCGTTRAYLSFFQLDFKSAFYWHPLFLFTVPLIFYLIYNHDKIITKKSHILLTTSVIYVIVYVVRFINLFPYQAPFDYNYDSVLYKVYDFIISMINK